MFIADAPIETLHHAVGFGCSGVGQPVLDAEVRAQSVELMLSGGPRAHVKQIGDL
jgi:hypothetical protein